MTRADTAPLLGIRYVAQFWRSHFSNSKAYQALENELCANVHNRIFDIRELRPDSPIISVRSIIRDIEEQEAAINGRNFASRLFNVVEFQIVSYDNDIVSRWLEENSDFSKGRSSDRSVAEVLGLHLQPVADILLFLCAVTFGGAISTEHHRCYLDEEWLCAGEAIKGFERTGEGQLFRLPEKSPFTLDQVIDWSKTCGGIWHGESRSGLEKGVSCLSHSFYRDYHSASMNKLVWSTAGLESIFCESNSAISEKLRRRMPLVCDMIEFENADRSVRDAYHFRSRILHGDKPIMNLYSPNDVDWTPKRYDAELEIYGSLLQALLLASIWKAISRGSTDLVFVERVDFR